MHRRSTLIITRQPEFAHRLTTLLSNMDVDMRLLAAPVSSVFREYPDAKFDLIIVDGDRDTLADLLGAEERLVEEEAPSLFLIVAPEVLESMRFPARLPHDFALRSASDLEYQVRLRRLLWPGEETGDADFIRVASLTLNLATYQVKVDGVTLDLTYLEYALLAFLMTHPGRTYSRDALLRRVWGFEYYGGSRTVDVHVRRVRAKLGPELAEHLETVRGVGYLWNM
jgi:DNA-binding response OmpR family regulator